MNDQQKSIYPYRDLIGECVAREPEDTLSPLWQKLALKTHLFIPTTDPDAREKAVGIQVAAAQAIIEQDKPATLVYFTDKPSTAFTVRKQNMRECLAPDILASPSRLDTVTQHWKVIDTLLEQDRHTFFVVSPKQNWKAMRDSQNKIWADMSQRYADVHGIHLPGPLPRDLNGALNIVGSEMFSINASQAQRKTSTPANFELWSGISFVRGAPHKRTLAVVDVLRNADGSHNQLLVPTIAKSGLYIDY